MKKHLILAVFFMSLLSVFTACEDKGNDAPQVVLEVQPATLDFPAVGATKKATVTCSNVDWSFASEAEWCKVERVENQLEITVDAFNELELRSTRVVVKTEGAEDKVINIRQSAAAEATLSITPDTLVVFAAKDPEAQLLTVETNQSKVMITKQTDTTWCKVTVSDDFTTVTVAPTTNKDPKERTASFTVQVGEQPNMKEMTFAVKQDPAKLVNKEKVVLNEIGYRVVVPVDAEQGTYTAVAADAWCKVNITAKGLEISAPAFKEQVDRTTTVSVEMDGKTMATINVTQTGGELKLHDPYYHDGQIVGVVGCIDAAWEGFFGYATIYVVALEEKEVKYSTEKKGILGITSSTTPAEVMKKVKAQADWKTKYPAFAYCDEMSQKTAMDEWTLGQSKDKMYYIYRNESGNDERGKALNSKLEELGGNPCNGSWYWTNVEVNDFNPGATNDVKVINGYYLFKGGLFLEKWFYKDEAKRFARCIWSCQYSVNKPTEGTEYKWE